MMRQLRAFALAGLAFLVGVFCATTRPFDPQTESCVTSTDCEVTGFAGCCSCDEEPRAVKRAWLAERTEICAVVACACQGKGCGTPCPRVANPRAFDAVCTHGRCEAIAR